MLNIPPRERMSSVSLRLPKQTLEMVRDLARNLKTSEAVVLRQIIIEFFSIECLQKSNGDLEGGTTIGVTDTIASPIDDSRTEEDKA